jgi:RNA polymerase sigma-70 factor (family 1)
MNRYRACPDLELLTLMGQHDEQAFSALYERYADKLYRFVYGKVKEKETTEEIIQEIFVSLWAKRDTLLVTFSLDAYLYGAARNKILSYIRSEKVRRRYAADFTLFAAGRIDNSPEELINLKDLQQSIANSMEVLPSKCQEAFRLSRLEHLPIPEIAKHMNISTRTVENYLTQALRHLRKTLGAMVALVVGLFV